MVNTEMVELGISLSSFGIWMCYYFSVLCQSFSQATGLVDGTDPRWMQHFMGGGDPPILSTMIAVHHK